MAGIGPVEVCHGQILQPFLQPINAFRRIKNTPKRPSKQYTRVVSEYADSDVGHKRVDILSDITYVDIVRLVLDTNIIVAAFRSRDGASNSLLRLVDARRVTPLCSTALFLEYEAVLSRAETRAVTGHDLEDVAAIMSALAALCDPVDISFRVRPLLRDAGDEMVLEAALNGQADAIVTYNVRDFGPARVFGIEIVAPNSIVGRRTK